MAYPATESRQQAFDRHKARCIFKVGDRVCFKRPKRLRIYGHIQLIEEDLGKMYWTNGGTVPAYIRVGVTDAEGVITYMWTNESKLLLVAKHHA